MGAHPPEPAPPLPEMPPAPGGDNEGAKNSEIEGVPPGYVYIHTPLPNIQFCCTVKHAPIVECVQAHAKVSLLYCVTRHVAFT